MLLDVYRTYHDMRTRKLSCRRRSRLSACSLGLHSASSTRRSRNTSAAFHSVGDENRKSSGLNVYEKTCVSSSLRVATARIPVGTTPKAAARLLCSRWY